MKLIIIIFTVLLQPIYPSYFVNCILDAEILEMNETEFSSNNSLSGFTFISLRLKIISENSCGADDSGRIILENIPVKEMNQFKKGAKMKVHYSYSSFDPPPDRPMSEIISWKFKGFLK